MTRRQLHLERVPSPPRHLRPQTRAWWRRVAAGYHLEEHHYTLLTMAGEALDRAAEARELLAAAGPTVQDRFGQVKEHPAARLHLASMAAYAKLIRELRLDDGPVGEEHPRLPRLLQGGAR